MSNRPLQTFQGACHCGAVRFQIETDFPELTMCDCSICKKKNALMVKVHESKFKLLAGEDALTEYQFHTKTASHYFCKICGIYPFHRKRGCTEFCVNGLMAGNRRTSRTGYDLKHKESSTQRSHR